MELSDLEIPQRARDPTGTVPRHRHRDRPQADYCPVATDGAAHAASMLASLL
jgi:hypothetical protein